MFESRANSCFTTVVDGTELGSVYLFQLKELNYENPEDEWALGARYYGYYDRFRKNYSYFIKKKLVTCAQLVVAGCQWLAPSVLEIQF